MRINEDDIKILFIVDWYDGPLSGMCLYNNEKHWFSAVDEYYKVDDKEYFRKFEVYPMTLEQVEEEEKWHRLFVEKVGDSFPYVDGKSGYCGKLKPERQWHEFYDIYKEYKRPIYTNAIAYFDME